LKKKDIPIIARPLGAGQIRNGHTAFDFLFRRFACAESSPFPFLRSMLSDVTAPPCRPRPDRSAAGCAIG
jgi:hypothetical protein